MTLFNKLVLFGVLMMVLFSQSVYSEENKAKTTQIYKWIDADGRVHYASRPGDASAKKMHFGSKVFHKKASDDTLKQEIQKNRGKQCVDAKEKLRKYKNAPFLFRYDEETNQKIRLTKKESKKTFLQAEKDVSYWCNPPRQE